jgi:hypothetical protein
MTQFMRKQYRTLLLTLFILYMKTRVLGDRPFFKNMDNEWCVCLAQGPYSAHFTPLVKIH